jgi:hypothetical protein
MSEIDPPRRDETAGSAGAVRAPLTRRRDGLLGLAVTVNPSSIVGDETAQSVAPGRSTPFVEGVLAVLNSAFGIARFEWLMGSAKR